MNIDTYSIFVEYSITICMVLEDDTAGMLLLMNA